MTKLLATLIFISGISAFAGTAEKFHCDMKNLQDNQYFEGGSYLLDITSELALVYSLSLVPNAKPKLVGSLERIYEGSDLLEVYADTSGKSTMYFIRAGNHRGVLSEKYTAGSSSFLCVSDEIRY